jgi:hypothetical protein
MFVSNVFGMSLSNYFLILIAGWAMQDLSPNDSPLTFPVEPYGVTASLNDSTWFGSAAAYKALFIANDSACSKQQVDIIISTDLPYDKRKTNRIVTGCVNGCRPTQQLFFHNIPLKVGKYSFSILGQCAGVDERRFVAEYWWKIDDDMIARNYTSQVNRPGWVEITHYDVDQKMLEGTFEMDLIDYDKRIARFRKGAFKVKITL